MERSSNTFASSALLFLSSRGASVIKVTDGDREIASFKRERMAPGEMEKLVIAAKKLEGVGDSIKIEVSDMA